MGNPLSRFNLTPFDRIEPIRFVDYDSTMTPLGDFEKITNINVIVNSWNNILLTPRGTYDHDPEYGSRLYEMLFQVADIDTMIDIKNEIYDTLSRYDNRAYINKVDVKFLKPPQKGFIVKIVAEYEGEKSELTVKIKDTAQ
jgi:phage baseplate assembly protein W